MAEKIKLLLVGLIIAAGIGSFYYFSAQPMLFRVLMLIGAAGFATVAGLQTGVGQRLWGFLKESRNEVRRMVWPTQRETAQVTLMVLVMVSVVAVMLWSFDWMLNNSVQFLIGSNG